ncbi:hypothetical protein Dsin_022534 [Dipteronia sinensis]|uniref:Hexosyltransferase n=1 Tax=Dipteronia sinensis TaxID=43782 RepID=A0AAE0E056_9ROSI|nr:hypothetical protein Dsin_022534 [Dipteronia sinensis]
MKQVDRNFVVFSRFRDNTSDPTLKNAFENCVTLYQNMKDILQADYKLSQHGKYDSITDLGQLTTLAYNCENEISSSSSPTAGITEDMLLIAQTAFVEYSKMIYLDGDIQVFENIDHLIDMPDCYLYAVMDCFCEKTWSHTPQFKIGYCQQCPDKVNWPADFGPKPAL